MKSLLFLGFLVLFGGKRDLIIIMFYLSYLSRVNLKGEKTLERIDMYRCTVKVRLAKKKKILYTLVTQIFYIYSSTKET